jgi:hypothetical protein
VIARIINRSLTRCLVCLFACARSNFPALMATFREEFGSLVPPIGFI